MPTSVGYGASFGGLTALLAMLNSLRHGRGGREHRQRLWRGGDRELDQSSAVTDTRAGGAVVDRVAEIEARSAAFRRELGLATLALTQIMYVVGSGWVGTAAKLGPSHVVFWSAGDSALLPAAGRGRHLPQPADAARGRALSVGDGRARQVPRVSHRVESLGVHDRRSWRCSASMIATNLAYLLAPMGATFTKAAVVHAGRELDRGDPAHASSRCSVCASASGCRGSAAGADPDVHARSSRCRSSRSAAGPRTPTIR